MPPTLDGILQDVRYGARGLARHRGFAVAAILAAALGIGASTAVFSAVDRILFRPLPYRDEARLASVGIMAPLDFNEFLLADGYFELRRHPGPFEAVTSFQAGAIPCDLTENHPLRLQCVRAEANFLATLGLAPAAGRVFSTEEDRPNGPRAAIISYGLWSSRFGLDPQIPGRTITLDGVPAVVTGVLPKDFLMPTLTGVDVLVPEALDEAHERSGRALRAFGRLKPGVTIEQARAELQPYFARVLDTVPPRFRKEVTLRVRGVRDRQVGGVARASATILAAVLGVLLIACANIANLLLARATGREREMAVRRALGASRARIARQVITESLMVGAAGGVAGCGLAWAMLRVVQATAPGGLPRLEEASLDPRVLAFAVAASAGSALLFGLAPVLWRDGGVAAGAARATVRATQRSRGWLRGGLVTAQVALSLMLLTGAGLLLRSLWNLDSVPLGIERDSVTTARFVLGRQRYGSPESQLAFFRELEGRLNAAPGLTAVAISDSLPPSGGTRGRPLAAIEVEGKPARAEGTGGMVTWRYVTPGYFRALGIPLRRGRGFGDEDRGKAVNSVVVSETLARQLFPGEEAIGRHILRDPQAGWFTVIGVAADARNMGLEKAAAAEYYLVRKPVPDATFAQGEPPTGWREASVVARTVVDPRLAAAAIRDAVAGLDPALPVEVESMRQRVDRITERPRFYATLLGVFAGAGALLAAIGLFGVLSFLVAQRRREIGVRVALGATPGEIARLTLGFAARWTGLGIAAGGIGALMVARWLQSLLFGVEAGDVRAIGAAAVMLGAVALVAAAGPARRAARLDPMESLREE
jgi:putative ABC transport system permease protein